MIKKTIWLVLLVLLTINSSHAAEQKNQPNIDTQSASFDDEWQDDWADETEELASWQTTGFIELAYGHFLQSNLTGNTSALKEARARLNIDYSHELFELNSKADGYYDGVLKKTIWQMRELNISTSPFESVDLKIGRQVLTWGTGDYLFLNDLFAKDWQSFFSGRHDEYLKAPSDSVRASWFSDNLAFTLVWTPQFTADNYVNGERFSFYSPATQQIIAPNSAATVVKTERSQWSARLSTSINNIEIAFYGYKGFWPTPQGINQQQQGYFPKLNSWGTSLIMPILGGIFNAEYAKYNSIEDQHGRHNNIANSQQRLLLGYEQELAKNFNGGLQYYVEKTENYLQLKKNSADIKSLVDKYRQLLTLRLTYQTQQQTLKYTAFIFYSPSDQDAYLKSVIDYRYNDQWQLSIGTNIFQGKNNFSFFGQHQDNSNLWLRARYQF